MKLFSNEELINWKDDYILKQVKEYGNIAFLSTFPPRECGIATFAEDLITSIDKIGIVNTQVIAISD